MKQILFLMLGLLAFVTPANATEKTISDSEILSNNYRMPYDKAFIFNEGGIEFAVYRDGQFDFYMFNYGPNITADINTPGFTLSFNSGYNYNPYIQYDNYGAIIQIENTPVYYDDYGRVNQIGDIFITYNAFNRINRIGGLGVYYRNHRFWRYDGYINAYNQDYIWRPWHRFYSVPLPNLCVVNSYPYRQYYTPIRHIWYRPYFNNTRLYHANLGRSDRTPRYTMQTSRRYAQTPRNSRERAIERHVMRRNTTIERTRNTRSTHSATARRNTSQGVTRNSNRLAAGTSSRTHSRSVFATQDSQTNRYNRASRSPRASIAKKSTVGNHRSIKKTTEKNVTKTRPSVSNRIERTTGNLARPSNASASRRYNTTSSKPNQSQSMVKNKRKPSMVVSKSDKGRRTNTKSAKLNTRRQRG